MSYPVLTGFHAMLVPAEGLEPSAFRSVGERSIQLSYAGNMVAEPGFEPGSPAYEAGGVPGLPYPAIETKCARWELNPQPIGYQPIAPTVVLLAHIEVETTLSSRPFGFPLTRHPQVTRHLPKCPRLRG